MSQQQNASLLWINKDATNVHRKKHVAEVNAHVQKSSSKKRTPKKPSAKRSAVSGQKLVVNVEPESSSTHSSHSKFENEFCSTSDFENSETASTGISGDACIDSNPHTPNALIFSSYLEDGRLPATDVIEEETSSLDFDTDIEQLSRRLELSLPSSLDASNPLPGLTSNLPDYDKMLIHTHLTYMPQMFYGLSSRAAYCPIRNSSVTNMLRAPVGFLWVLVSLEMFLETARRSNARKAFILQRKNHAYQLMSRAFSDRSCSNHENMLLGSQAAAITELFCGDPAKALTHLNGIDAFLTARGGTEYVKKLDCTISMPLFAVMAYRTLLQDNLTTQVSFERARASFMHHMHALVNWSSMLTDTLTAGIRFKKETSPHDEGYNDDFDMADSVHEFQDVRKRAFVRHPILSKFVMAEFATDKPGERVDHFILLFNLNRVIADHGTNFKGAILFIEAFVQDTELSGTTRGADSSIKISGVLRLLTNRLARMFPHEPSLGIVHAWDALDALEVMKLFTLEIRKSILHLLHALLVGDIVSTFTEKQLVVMESAMTNEWHTRHPRQVAQPG